MIDVDVSGKTRDDVCENLADAQEGPFKELRRTTLATNFACGLFRQSLSLASVQRSVKGKVENPAIYGGKCVAVIPDDDLLEMRRILRVCANQFKRFERAERAKVANSPLSLVEAQEAQAAADQHHAFIEACEKYAVPDEH